MRRTPVLAAAAALAAATLSVTALPGTAGAAARDGDAQVKAAATTRADHRRIVDYWTPKRMRNAIPVERLIAERSTSSASGTVARGEPTVVGPQAKPESKGKPTTTAAGGTGGFYTGGGDVVATTGKVFFTEGGSNYVCSGSSTYSGNHDVVTTAGHCVNEGPGAYVTNFAFVPAYDDGARPYGTFTARQLVTTSQWKNSGDFNYDVGFAVMNSLNGKDLTDTVGSQNIGFNLARGQLMYSFGYPAAKKYDGSDLAYCYGTVFDDTYGNSTDQGMNCDMTGGSSGGPWLVDFSTGSGTGTLNSVNSFGYRGLNNIMWGPYFGSVIESTYNTAAGL